MSEIACSITTETEGVGYGTHVSGHPKCHKGSIGASDFMSTVFNE
jgi:hypothetical protein